MTEIHFINNQAMKCTAMDESACVLARVKRGSFDQVCMPLIITPPYLRYKVLSMSLLVQKSLRT